MNKLFVDDLVESLNICVGAGGCVYKQVDIKKRLGDCNQYDKFPMISFEFTNDSNIQVDVDESKFLNDPMHQGTWIYGTDIFDEDDIVFVVNLKSQDNILYIDTLEVNTDHRKRGLGGRLVSIIENVACNYFDYVVVSPFDTDAMNFWNHIGYIEDNRGNWVRDLTV